MNNLRLVRSEEVEKKTGLSRTTIWRLERDGGFPRRRRVGPRACAWIEEEVDQWILSRSYVGLLGDSMEVSNDLP